MIARDVSERKLIEERLHKANQEMEQRAARNLQLEAASQELDALSYAVSHDLRAPLRHMLGFARLLQQAPADRLDDETRRRLHAVAESAKQMGKLVDGLLDFSRLGRAQLHQTRVSLDELVKTVLSDLHQEMEGRNIE